MAQLPIDYGATANNGLGTNWRTAWQRTQDNFTDLYALQSRTVNAGDVRFASQPTTESKISAAIAQAIIELAGRVFIPANMLPYDASLVTFNSAVQVVREGGDSSVYDVLAYGATGDGAHDDTPSFVAAFQAVDAAGSGGGVNASGGGTMFVPPGDYLMGSNPFLTVTSLHPCRVLGAGMQSTTIKKGFNGTWFSFGLNFGNYLRWENMTFDGQHDAGRTGAGFVYTGQAGGAGNDYHSFSRCRFLAIESHFSLGQDAAQNLAFLDCESYPSTAQQATGEYTFFALTADDTGARHRRFTHNLFNMGVVDISGCGDIYMATTGIKRLHTSATSAQYFIASSFMGNSDTAHPFKGSGAIVGCRIAGDVVIDASFSGIWFNYQTAGTFVDNTTSAGAATVLHHPLSASYAFLDHLRFSGTKNPEEIQTWRVSADQGDASPAQLVLDQGVTIAWFNTPLTGNRTVTLPAVTGNRDGKTIRVVRSKAATGASTLTVDTTPNTVLAAGQWVDCSRNGPLSQWTPTAGGTLP